MIDIRTGNCLEILPRLEAGSVQCCVSSPPYWGLRDYGVEGAFGLEETPELYVGRMVAVFREVKRVLRDDGTLWLNLGDSYYGAGQRGSQFGSQAPQPLWAEKANRETARRGERDPRHGLKFKDLVGIPWRVAFALQADGWYLRSDIIWHKPNPMPESVTDRPTKSHEYIFLLSKSAQYFYDADAIKEPAEKIGTLAHLAGRNGKRAGSREGLRRDEWISRKRMQEPGFQSLTENEVSGDPSTRNRRTVWTFATQPYAEAHFATFPEELPKLCILAGSKPGDTILDPFAGSGTTGKVAIELGRKAVLVELNPAYIELAQDRCDVTPGWY